eukprot:m.14691 g.14691  ORF g.14691 m.14691 type:complete len:138 (+) comp5188_c0_seq1:294-707(+)
MTTNSTSELRTKGNAAFKKKQYKEACMLYGRGVKILSETKDGFEELSILYSNMAMCHIKLGEPELAVANSRKGINVLQKIADKELLSQSQQSIVIKLIFRMATSYGMMKQWKCGLDSLKEAQNVLKSMYEFVSEFFD